MSSQSDSKDNFVITVSKTIQHFKIPVTVQSIKEQLKTHPNYPTLKSVTDTLDHFNIRNYPVQITDKELEQVDQPFIAHTYQKDNELVLVKLRSDKGFFISDNTEKDQVLSKGEFLKIFSGVVILIEPTSDSGEIEYKSKRQDQILKSLLTPALIVTTLLAAFLTLTESDLTFTNHQLIFLGTKLLGLSASILLTINELKAGNRLAQKICRIGKKADCNTVTAHTSATVFAWIKWSDLGVIYFLTGFLFACGGSRYFGALQLLSVVALPYIFYSIYLQTQVIKKWCPLCLAVLLIILSEFLLTLSVRFELISIPIFPAILVPSLVTVVFLLTRFSFATSLVANDQKIKYKRIKRIPGVLEYLLKREQQIELIINSRSLLFAYNSHNKKRVSVFLSLDCQYCAEVFQSLKTISQGSESLQLHIIPVTKNDPEQKQFTARLYRTYQEKDQQAALTLLDQWYSKVYRFEGNNTGEPSTDEKAFMRDNSLMALKNQISGFPAVFLEGYKLPENYQLSEIRELATSLTGIPHASSKAEMII